MTEWEKNIIEDIERAISYHRLYPTEILEIIKRKIIKAVSEMEDGEGIYKVLNSRGLWKDYLGNDND